MTLQGFRRASWAARAATLGWLAILGPAVVRPLVAPAAEPPVAPVRPILALAVAPQDDWVACGQGDRVRLYDLRGPRYAGELLGTGGGERPGEPVRSLAFDRAGRRLAVGAAGEVRLWRRPETLLRHRWSLEHAVRSAAVGVDGTTVVVGDEGGGATWGQVDGAVAARRAAGHEGAVVAVAATAEQVLTAGADRRLRIWRASDGEPLAAWRFDQELRAVAASGDSSQIVVATADGTLRRWTLAALLAAPADGAAAPPPPPLGELPAVAPGIVTAQFPSGASDRLLTACEDGRARWWDLSQGSSLRDLGHESKIAAAAVSGDGRRIATVGPGGARLWNPADGALIAQIKTHPRAVRTLQTIDGARVAALLDVEYRKREFRETEESLKRETAVLEGAMKAKETAEKAVQDKTAAAMQAIAARTAAQKLADERAADAALADQARAAARAVAEQAEAELKRLQQAAEEARAAAAKAPGDGALAAKLSEADTRLAAVRTAKQMADERLAQTVAARTAAERAAQEAKRAAEEARNRAQGPERELTEALNARIGAVNFIATAAAVLERAKAAVPTAAAAVGQAEQTAARLEAEKQTAVQQAAVVRPFRSAAFSLDSRRLALGGEDGGFVVIDAQSGALIEALDPPTSPDAAPAPIVALGAARRGDWISAAGKAVAVWQSPVDWTLERALAPSPSSAAPPARVAALDFRPDGSLLAVAGGTPGEAGELQCWNPADGTLVRRFERPHDDQLSAAKFSPDGGRIATVGADRSIKIWQVDDGRLLQTLTGHAQQVLGVVWSPDGKRLASCSADPSIKIWNLDTGAAVRTLRGDTYRVGEYRRAITGLQNVGTTQQFLASAGDRTIRLHRWDAANDIRCYQGGQAYHHAAAATSDGKWVVGGGQDGVLHFWNGENGYRQFAFAPDRPGEALKAQ